MKKELPPTPIGKAMAATPIVMTVVATMLAGLASSEMTKAQYDRGLAAQLQSKAGDQWSYFQAKKLRSAVARNSLEVLAATVEVPAVDPAVLSGLDDPAQAALTQGKVPQVAPVKLDDRVAAALTAVEQSRPETEVTTALTGITKEQLGVAMEAARQTVLAEDALTKPLNQALDNLESKLLPGDTRVYRGFAAGKLRYLGSRYDVEARLNQTVANLYELQVRVLNASAERHHARSGKFFLGMLAAQMGVIIATFSLAAKQKSLLWALAAAAGAGAVAFASYVYFCL